MCLSMCLSYPQFNDADRRSFEGKEEVAAFPSSDPNVPKY
jgi:hypothetical protein